MKIAVPPLTPRQEELMEYIVDYLAREDCQPSYREMAKWMGIRNVNGVVCHIEALIDKGYLRKRAKHLSRSLEIDWDLYNSSKKGARR